MLSNRKGALGANALARRPSSRTIGRARNPAINPARDLAGYIGELTSFHDPDDAFYFKPEYVTQLRLLTPRAVTQPERYLPVIAKGDEVLDWREMSGRYDSSPMKLIDGSDHALSDFDEHLPAILAFLGL